MSFLHLCKVSFTTLYRVVSDIYYIYLCGIMKHVSILVPKGLAIVDTIIGSYNLLKLANNHHRRLGLSEKGLFEIDLVGMTKEPHSYNNFLNISPTRAIFEISKTDLIIIPGLVGDMQTQIKLNYPLIDWMRAGEGFRR